MERAAVIDPEGKIRNRVRLVASAAGAILDSALLLPVRLPGVGARLSCP
jgi:hypothetical protein